MVPWAEAFCVGSWTEAAVTVAVAGVGPVAGTEYTPDAEMVPTVALPPLTLLTCQVTAVFCAFVTVAVKACVPPVGTFAVVVATLTPTGGGGDVIVTWAEPLRVGSWSESAAS